MCILIEGGLPWEGAEGGIEVDLGSKLVGSRGGTRQGGLYISSFHSCSRFIIKEGWGTLRRDGSQMGDRALPATLTA